MSDTATLEASAPSPTADVAHGGRTGENAVVVGLYAASVAVALIASGALIAATGGSWQRVLSALLDGSHRSRGRWGHTLGIAAPLVLVGLGTAISGRAGLTNIGQEGQVTVGSAVATYVGVHLFGPGPFVLVGLLTAGFVAGAVWAGIAAVLLYWRRVPEVLTTLLLITVGTQLVGYGLDQQWLLLAPINGGSSHNVVSEQLSPDSRIPRIKMFGNEYPSSVFVVVILAIVVAIIMRRTVWGFRLRMLGQNARTAKRAGVSEWRYGVSALMLSGGFAGLAGAAMLAGGDFGAYRLTPFFAVSIGFDGLLVALVARQNPFAIVPVAFVFAILRTGSGFLAATGVSREITDIVQALLVLSLLVPPAILHIRERRRALAAISART